MLVSLLMPERGRRTAMLGGRSTGSYTADAGDDELGRGVSTTMVFRPVLSHAEPRGSTSLDPASMAGALSALLQVYEATLSHDIDAFEPFALRCLGLSLIHISEPTRRTP